MGKAERASRGAPGLFPFVTPKAMPHLTPYQQFIVTTFLFFVGSVAGWFLELFYRRFFSPENPSRAWLNPGFLAGPWVPLYGFGVVVLYALSYAEHLIISLDSGGTPHYAVMFGIMALAMTAIEYLAGVIFVRGMHIRLWDYSKRWGNIQGIICPQFTLYWAILSALYYFLLFPLLARLVLWFIGDPWISFTVGMAFSLFLVDFAFSANLSAKLRAKAREIDRKSELDFQKMQAWMRENGRSSFFTPRSSLVLHGSLSTRLDNFEAFLKRRPGRIPAEPSLQKDGDSGTGKP